MGAVRAGELPVKPGLTDAGLTDDGDDLAVPGSGSLEGLVKLMPSPSRPTRRQAARSGARNRERTVLAPTISKTSTGRSRPLTFKGPSGFT